MTDRFGTISIDSVSSGSKTPSPSSRQKQKKKSKKTVPAKKKGYFDVAAIVVIVLFFLIGGYSALGFWAVPKYITSSLPEKIQKDTGLTLEISQVRFHPFTFNLVVDDVVLSNPDKPTPLAQLQSFQADIALIPLLKGELVTTNLLISNLNIDIIRNENGEYNFSQTLTGKQQKVTGEIFDFTELPFLFSLNNIAIRDSKVTFTDVPKSSTHHIEHIELSLPNLSNFSFAAEDYIHPSFSAVINGSPVNLTGQAAISGNNETKDSLQTNLAIHFDLIDLPLYFDYLPATLPFDITQGKATGDLQLSFSQVSAKEKLAVEFSFEATDTVAIDQQKLFNLKIPVAKFEGTLHPFTQVIRLNSVVLREPVFQSGSDFSEIFSRKIPSDSPNAINRQSGSITDSSITIQSALIDNGTYLRVKGTSADVIDKWESIQFGLKNYASTGALSSSEQTRFRISAEQSDSQATMSWQGTFDAQGLPAGDIHLDNISADKLFTFVDLTSISQTSGTADAKGFISIRKTPDASYPFTAYIEEGNCSLYDLELKDDDIVWYKSAVSKISGFSKKGKLINLGDIQSQNSSIAINIDSLPAILNEISAQNSLLGVDSLDISGALRLSKSNSSTPELVFPEISVQAIHLNKNDIAQERDNLTIRVQTEQNGVIQAKGKIQINPMAAHLNTQFHNLNSLKILPWFSDHTLLKQIDAELSGKGDFSYPDVGFTGELSLKEGALSENDKKYFSWEHIEFPDLLYSRTPSHIGGTTCNISSPKLQLNHDASSKHIVSTLNTFFQKHIPSKHSNHEKTTIVPQVDFKEISITSGQIEVTDSRLKPSWTGEISEFNGRLEKFTSSPQAPPTLFSFEGLLDSVTFSLSGKNHFFDASKQGESTLTINDFPLPSFHAQLSEQLDIDSSHGSVSVAVNTTWVNDKLTQDSQLVFSQIDPISPTSQSALTLALISDADKIFTLSSSTERDLNDLQSSVFSDAVTSFKKLVIKGSVSPLLLLPDDYKDLSGNEFAEFYPGQTELTGAGRESLSRFSNFLSSHPQTGITVTGSADSIVDTAALTRKLEIIERDRVEAENRIRKNSLQQAKEEYLQKIIAAKTALGEPVDYIEEKIPLEIFQKFAPLQAEPIAIDERLLIELAQKRARVITDFFTEKLALEPKRITVNAVPRITTDSSSQGNRVLFSIGTYSETVESQVRDDTIEFNTNQNNDYQ
ncbi:DUF748 domain-containing protein [Desulfosediminicola flagellatus]|uniref:DUF748 domain-containing protein n=1 Tax=Desulfosediminicola flagellatus TaxID=2569541 RepID=UPI0010AD91C9|nr:DUF748 domain-containing protein [Desulfosediminicola flagellatus]